MVPSRPGYDNATLAGLLGTYLALAAQQATASDECTACVLGTRDVHESGRPAGHVGSKIPEVYFLSAGKFIRLNENSEMQYRIKQLSCILAVHKICVHNAHICFNTVFKL